MKKITLLTNFVLISSLIISCASTIYLQPHVSPITVNKPFDSDAEIVISLMDLEREYTGSPFWGGDIRVPLVTPFQDLAQETFIPFFNRIFIVSNRDYSTTPYMIEIEISSFKVTGGLDTHLKIACTVSDNENVIFSNDYDGSGVGRAWAGFFGGLFNKNWGQEQMRNSAE
jgi:hypothetical protein